MFESSIRGTDEREQESKPAGLSISDVYDVCKDLANQASTVLDRFSRMTDKPASSSPQEFKATGISDEWLVLIHLAGSVNEEGGTAYKFKNLQKLAEATKDKPVTIMVQSVHPATNESEKPTVERFLIKDGKIKQVGKRSGSHGFAGDIEDFVGSSKDHASKKTALFALAHGEGNRGMHGDNGHAKLPEIVGSIQRGLSLGGREKLDVLDFDSCVMAQSGVVDKSRAVTKHLIASPEIENSNTPRGIDGQNLNAITEGLLNNPKLDGSQFGKLIVDLARDGRNDSVENNRRIMGTFALSHFDMAESEKFTASLNKFGEAMAAVVKDDRNRAIVDGLIDTTPRFGTLAFGAEMPLLKYDLQAFCQSVVKACESGQLHDSDGKLVGLAKDVLGAQSKLTPDSYGADTFIDYSKLGNLSVFMPPTYLRDAQQSGISATTPGMMMNSLDRFAKDKKEDSFDQLQLELRNATKRLAEDKEGSSITKELEALTMQLKNSTSEAARTSAIAAVRNKIDALVKLPIYSKPIEEESQKTRQLRDTLYAEELLDKDSGWSQFVRALRIRN